MGATRGVLVAQLLMSMLFTARGRREVCPHLVSQPGAAQVAEVVGAGPAADQVVAALLHIILPTDWATTAAKAIGIPP